MAHIYTNKNYVLRTIGNEYQQLKDWKYFNIMVFENKHSHQAIFIDSYEQLVELLKDYDKVYSFYKVESLRNGEIAYDIILKEDSQ